MSLSTKDRILETAYELCKAEYGAYTRLTRKAIGDKMGLKSYRLINYHWGGRLRAIKDEILRLAIERGDYHIVGSAIGAGDDTAKELPFKVKKRALTEVLG